MKRLYVFVIFLLLFMPAAPVFSQENDESLNSEPENERQAFFFLFSEGPAISWLTRIIKQSGRSNFVFNDFLLGVYSRVDMHFEENITPMARLAVFYPLETSFNKYPQKPKSPLHIGMDMNLGVNFNILEFSYFRLNAGPAFHLFFLNSDRWNYFELGMAAFSGMELPISERWTLICGLFASLDNGNLGANRNIEPFDIVYQYQVDIGVRYSKNLKNDKSLFPPKESALESSLIMR
jgi:hypothetical protein